MENKMTLKAFLHEWKKSNFVRENIPLGFGAGLPIVQIKNKKICILIPYFKFVRGSQVDKSMIYPIKYYMTVLYPTGKMIEFEDLEYSKIFSNVNFSKPIGLFRHEAIKTYTASQYSEKRNKLLCLYDKFINFLGDGDTYNENDEAEFESLLNALIEPSLIPIYKVLDDKFSKRFLHGGDME